MNIPTEHLNQFGYLTNYCSYSILIRKIVFILFFLRITFENVQIRGKNFVEYMRRLARFGTTCTILKNTHGGVLPLVKL